MRLYCFRTVCAAVLIGASSMLTMAQRPVSPPAPPESGTSADQSGPPAGAQPVGAPAAGDDAAALAQQLSNPVASLISLPFQSNFDFGMGASGDGMRQTMNIQPVVPVKLNRDWNLISRTVTPIIAQRNVVGTSSQFGIGDVLQSFFISPNSAEPFVWGVGPAILIPTATDDVLGSGKLGLGPTAVVLKQRGGWTVGTLANHIWSVAGDDDRADVNSTFVQPFISYTTRTAWTYTANTESSYNWVDDLWSVPINLQVTKLVRFGTQPVSVGVGLRYWAATTPNGPQGFGFRVIVSPLWPTGRR